MSGMFADGHEDDERWLRAHKKHFPTKTNQFAQKRKKAALPIMKIGKTTQVCPKCSRPAPIETFRDAMCMACQVGTYLSTL